MYNLLKKITIICGVCSTAYAGELAKPNIVFILADDLGWMDLGHHGNEFYETPHIDALATSGMVFNRAYSGGPNCAPTRACIMSGMYGPRTSMWQPSAESKGPFNKMRLLVPNRENEKGRSFKSVTYLEPEVVSLAEILKPAGYISARFGKWHLGENTQGFDISSYSGNSEKDYKTEGRGYQDQDNSQKITDASLRFIEENTKQPFFLYLSHFEVHTPLVAKESITKKYKEKLASQQWDKPFNPKYAAMIEALDNSVGRITQKIEELGLSENTIIIFSSDNGGVGKVTPIKPFKSAKGSLHEGGVRVPMYVKWLGKTTAGSTNDTPITSVDFMPTFAELAGVDVPSSQPVDGVSIVPLLQGNKIPERSIFWHYPLYLKGEVKQDQVIPIYGASKGFWRATPSSAICRGDWKLIQYFEDGHIELYNVVQDVSEKQNLALEYPEKVAILKKELEQWQQRTQAPIPTTINPSFTN